MARRRSVWIFLAAILTAQSLSACASKSFQETATDEQLYDKGMRRLAAHEDYAKHAALTPSAWFRDIDFTRGYFIQLRKRYPASNLAPLATLRIADTYYLEKNYEEAVAYYDEFIGNLVSYPAHQAELDQAKSRRDASAEKMLTPDKLYANGMERIEFRRQGVKWNPAGWQWGENPWAHWSYDGEDTRRYFQDIRSKYPVSKEAPLSLLRIADTYYDDEQYTEALVYYEEFIKNHPTFREEAAYAQLRRASCYSHEMLAVDRDPAASLNAKDAYDTLQRDYGGSPEALGAGGEAQRVNLQLGEQEVFVADFYYRRSLYRAAINRYKGLIDLYPDHPLVGWSLYRLGLSAEALGDYAGARSYFQKALSAPATAFRNPDDVKFADAYLLFLAYPNADATEERVKRDVKIRIAILDLIEAPPLSPVQPTVQPAAEPAAQPADGAGPAPASTPAPSTVPAN